MFSIFNRSQLLCNAKCKKKINGLLSKWTVQFLIKLRNIHDVPGNTFCPNSLRGIDHLRDPRLNKGLAFTLEERQTLGLHGLLAANFKTMEQQLEICRISLARYEDDLNKYLYLNELQDTNEGLFYSLLNTNIEEYLPIVYTPTVGLACQRFGLVYKRTRGLFITIHDKGYIFNILKNWPEHNVKAVVFTDGERILGLGDLGAYGMGIPVGKLSLYTALAGIRPHQCLPIFLDVGTNNKELLEDPLYIGLRQNRTVGKDYDDFIEEFMSACVKRYGPNTLLQFEDFAIGNATRLLDKYIDEFCTFNDDIQGTASVAVSGLIAAQRVTNKKMSDNVYMFLGAGSAAIGICNIIVEAMVEEGLSINDAQAKVYLFDKEGLLTADRGDIMDQAKKYAKEMNPEKSFENAVVQLKPTCLIGVSTAGGAFTPAILKQMAKNTERPIIFAMSNPTSKAECTAQHAYDYTEGRCLFASGSPFPPVNYNGKEYITGQGNNSYIFPGVALGVIASASHRIPQSMFLTAAKTLANLVSDDDFNKGRLYPPLAKVRNLSVAIAKDIIEFAYHKNVATLFPKPTDVDKLLQQIMYDLSYRNFMPKIYKYPKRPKGLILKTVDEAYKNIIPKLKPKPKK